MLHGLYCNNHNRYPTLSGPIDRMACVIRGWVTEWPTGLVTFEFRNARDGVPFISALGQKACRTDILSGIGLSVAFLPRAGPSRGGKMDSGDGWPCGLVLGQTFTKRSVICANRIRKARRAGMSKLVPPSGEHNAADLYQWTANSCQRQKCAE